MPLQREDIRASLLRKGFREKTHGDHDRYFLYIGEEKQPIFTKLSRGGGYSTYSDNLLSLMARQLKITKGSLLKLVECTLDSAGYLEILRQQGTIS